MNTEKTFSLWTVLRDIFQGLEDSRLVKKTKKDTSPLSVAQFHNKMSELEGVVGNLFEIGGAILTQRFNELLDHKLEAQKDFYEGKLKEVDDRNASYYAAFCKLLGDISDDAKTHATNNFKALQSQAASIATSEESRIAKVLGVAYEIAKQLHDEMNTNVERFGVQNSHIAKSTEELHHAIADARNEVLKNFNSSRQPTVDSPTPEWIMDKIGDLGRFHELVETHMSGDSDQTLNLIRGLRHLTGYDQYSMKQCEEALKAAKAEWGMLAETTTASVSSDEDKPVVSYDESYVQEAGEEKKTTTTGNGDFAVVEKGYPEREAAGAVQSEQAPEHVSEGDPNWPGETEESLAAKRTEALDALADTGVEVETEQVSPSQEAAGDVAAKAEEPAETIQLPDLTGRNDVPEGPKDEQSLAEAQQATLEAAGNTEAPEFEVAPGDVLEPLNEAAGAAESPLDAETAPGQTAPEEAEVVEETANDSTAPMEETSPVEAAGSVEATEVDPTETVVEPVNDGPAVEDATAIPGAPTEPVEAAGAVSTETDGLVDHKGQMVSPERKKTLVEREARKAAEKLKKAARIAKKNANKNKGKLNGDKKRETLKLLPKNEPEAAAQEVVTN